MVLYVSANIGSVGFCEAFVLDPLVDGVESTCESRVRAWGENRPPNRETPVIRKQISGWTFDMEWVVSGAYNRQHHNS